MELYILMILLVIASVWDIKTYKIPNALTIFGVVLGLGTTLILNGWMGLLFSILSVVIIFILLVPTWLFFGVGAGDVKLVMVITSFLGFYSAITIGFYAIVMSSIIFLMIIPFKRIIEIFNDYLYLLYYKIPLLSDKSKQKKIPFACMLLAGFMLEKMVFPLF